MPITFKWDSNSLLIWSKWIDPFPSLMNWKHALVCEDSSYILLPWQHTYMPFMFVFTANERSFLIKVWLSYRLKHLLICEQSLWPTEARQSIRVLFVIPVFSWDDKIWQVWTKSISMLVYTCEVTLATHKNALTFVYIWFSWDNSINN